MWFQNVVFGGKTVLHRVLLRSRLARGKNYKTISRKHHCQTGWRPKRQMNLQWSCQKYRNTLDLTFRFSPTKVAFWRQWKWREYFLVHTSHLDPNNSHLFSFCFSIFICHVSSLATTRSPSTCRCSLEQRTTVTWGRMPSTRCTGSPGKPWPQQAKKLCSQVPKFSKFLFYPKTTCQPGRCQKHLRVTLLCYELTTMKEALSNEK